jgi:hypothetical protein
LQHQQGRLAYKGTGHRETINDNKISQWDPNCTVVVEHGKYSAVVEVMKSVDVPLSGALVVAPVVCDMAEESELYSPCASFQVGLDLFLKKDASSSDG